jgi:hypothetical protein
MRDKPSRLGHLLVIQTIMARSPARSRTRYGVHQGDVELMAEKKVFDFKPAWWLEQIDYEGCKQVHDRKHRFGCS